MSTALTETGQEPKGTLQWYLDQPSYKNRFNAMLRDRAPQFMSSIITLAASPNFADVEPRSIIASAAIAATLDLPINQNLGYAWIIPYKDNQRNGQKFAQFQMAARGYIQLALRTGQYKRLNARAINAEAFGGYDDVGEAFIHWDLLDETKEAVGYAFTFKLINGFVKCEYWTRKKIAAHAEKYSQNHAYHLKQNQKHSYKCKWCTDFDAMALKTVVANTLRKWGILSVEMQKAIAADQGVVTDIDAQTVYPDSPTGDGNEEGNGNQETSGDGDGSQPEPKASKADQMASKLAPEEPVASSSSSPEEPNEATEPAGDEPTANDMAQEDAVRARLESLYDKCVAAKKKMTAQDRLTKAFKTANPKEVQAKDLGSAIDVLTALLES